MPSAAPALVVLFSVFLALWPAVFLVAAAWHSFARRWRQLGQIAMLVPLWSIAASIALVQGPRLLRAFEPSAASGPSPMTIVAMVFALCCAAIAWALLVRSLMGPPPAAQAH